MIGRLCCHTIRKDHYIKYICTYWRHFRSTDKSAACCWNALSCPEKQLVGKIFLWSLHRCRISLGARLQQKLEPWAGNWMKVRWVAKYTFKTLKISLKKKIAHFHRLIAARSCAMGIWDFLSRSHQVGCIEVQWIDRKIWCARVPASSSGKRFKKLSSLKTNKSQKKRGPDCWEPLENLPKFPETAFAAWLLQRMLGTLSACVPRNPSDESWMQIRIFIFHEETMPVSCLALLQHTPTLSLEDSLSKPTKSWESLRFRPPPPPSPPVPWLELRTCGENSG